MFERAFQLRADKRWREAASEFERVLEVYPEHAAAWGVYGEVLIELRDADGAIASFERAVELAPRNSIASGMLYFTLMEQGKGVEAAAEARRFLRLVRSGAVKDPFDDLVSVYERCEQREDEQG